MLPTEKKKKFFLRSPVQKANNYDTSILKGGVYDILCGSNIVKQQL